MSANSVNFTLINFMKKLWSSHFQNNWSLICFGKIIITIEVIIQYLNMHICRQLNVSPYSKLYLWHEGLVLLIYDVLGIILQNNLINLYILRSQAWKENSMNMDAIMYIVGSFILIVSLLGKLRRIVCVWMACMKFAHMRTQLLW